MGEQPRRHVDRERRAVATAVLVGLHARDALTTAHVRQAATGLGVDARTVWRWIAEARSDPDSHGPGHADRGYRGRHHRVGVLEWERRSVSPCATLLGDRHPQP